MWWYIELNFLKKTEYTVRYRAMIYKVVVQTVLLYESKSWVIT